jgi:uncharacterized integral membrane protein
MPPDLKIPNNTEIDQALKEFEMKSGQSQVNTTQTVLADDSVPVAEIKDSPKMVEFVIRNSGGLIKDRRQAEYILLGVVVISILVTLFLVFAVINKKPKILDNNSVKIPLIITP